MLPIRFIRSSVLVMALSLAGSGIALADGYSASLSLGMDHISLGSLNLSLPMGMLRLHEKTGSFLLGQTLSYGRDLSHSSDSILEGAIHAQYLDSWASGANWSITPEAGLGYLTLQGSGSRLSAMYANAGLSGTYAVTSALAVTAKAMGGTDFGLNLPNGLQGKSGLTYSGTAAIDWGVGPGSLSAGYRYQHLPLLSGTPLVTDQYFIGYRVTF